MTTDDLSRAEEVAEMYDRDAEVSDRLERFDSGAWKRSNAALLRRLVARCREAEESLKAQLYARKYTAVSAEIDLALEHKMLEDTLMREAPNAVVRLTTPEDRLGTVVCGSCGKRKAKCEGC